MPTRGLPMGVMPLFLPPAVARGLLLVVAVLTLALPAGGSAAAPAPAPDSARTAAPLSSDRTWPGRTIRYHETLPARWQWSLDAAIAHWNRAGSDIRFVEVRTRARAHVTIGYGDTDGSDAWATIGPSDDAHVHLSPRYRRVDARPADQRVWVGRLLTHELGHVLGFEHTHATCSLMVPVYDFRRCGLLTPGRPDWYQCRWIDSRLLQRLVATYGGAPQRPAVSCRVGA